MQDSKAYPRDLTQYGRFRVVLKDPLTGAPKVEGITTSGWSLIVPSNAWSHLISTCASAIWFTGRALLQAMGELIPKLKSRADGKVLTRFTPSPRVQSILNVF